MKKFLLNIIYLLLPLLIIAYPLDRVMSYFLSQSHESPGEYEIWNDIYHSNANCDIAIYGASRAWVHIDPKILSDSLNVKVYNFGIDGHNFWLQYLRHIELLKYNKKPKTIILCVDFSTLEKRNDLYQLDQFLPYMLWNSNIRKYTSSYIGYQKIDYYIPLIRYSGKRNSINQIIKNILKKQPSEKYRNNGFLGIDKTWNADLKKAKEKIGSYKVKLDTNSINLFEKFIKQSQSNDIELIFVNTPEYIEGQEFVSNRDDIIDLYENISDKYSIRFYDYSNDSMCLDKTYFYNATHLNKLGAETFSRKFSSDLKVQMHKTRHSQ